MTHGSACAARLMQIIKTISGFFVLERGRCQISSALLLRAIAFALRKFAVRLFIFALKANCAFFVISITLH